jgi:hypothetical protein
MHPEGYLLKRSLWNLGRQRLQNATKCCFTRVTKEKTMKTQFTLPNGEPTDCTIEITTEHSASSHGIPILVNESGDAIDPMSWNYHRIVYATPEEIEQLKSLGLHTHQI